MRIVIAPDSYKCSVSAVRVADAMARGALRVFPDAEVLRIPIADGGEGTLEALVRATGGRCLTAQVTAPLGDKVSAQWGILGDEKTAVIEMAAASGLPLIPAGKRNPRLATSYGTGELIKTALDAGLRRIILGIGGSATNDGGAGLAQALGIRLTRADGSELPFGGAALRELAHIDLQNLDARLQETQIVVACDVDNPLCGPRGASAVFGPQKGATPTMVAELDAALAHFAACASRATGRLVAERPGAGAAGGLGAAMLFFTSAVLKPGVDIVLDAVGFSALVEGADFVLTGEGRTDFQTASGKAPVGVARVAKRFNVPVFCLSGSLGEGAAEVLAHGVDATLSICDGPMTLEGCMEQGEMLIESASERLFRVIKAVRCAR